VAQRETRSSEPPRDPPQRRRIASAAWLLTSILVMMSPGCAGVQPAVATLPEAPPLPAGTLRIRLAFDASVDLDLYVTGPLQETVYFANSPAKTGGELERDLRCDAPPGVRVETARFPKAAPGRYRVGVDFPERCGLGTGPARYVVVVDGAGVAREQRGTATFGVFEPVVLEFDATGVATSPD